MKNKLLYFTKNDIPFIAAKTSVHNPTIAEIGLIGEDHFRIGVKLITDISEKLISQQDNFDSNELTDFDIFMSMMNNRDKEYAVYRFDVLSVMALLFPNFSFKINKDNITLTQNEVVTFINKDTFSEFKEIVLHLFTTEKEQKEAFKPADGMAKKIADKLKKGRQKVSEKKGDRDVNLAEVSLFQRQISILSVGENKDINILLGYTVQQLEEEFERFQRKEACDQYRAIALAGAAKDIEAPDDWKGEI